MYKPDVALIDVNMPIMDGIATTKRIRIVSPKTRIIMLSAHNDSSYFDSAIRAGAQGYLTKEIDIKGLVEALRLVMKGERVFSKGFSESIVTSRGEALKSLPSDIKLTKENKKFSNWLLRDSRAWKLPKSCLSAHELLKHIASIY